MKRDQLIASGQALLDLDARGALVPHGIGGHARSIIEGFIAIERTPAPDQTNAEVSDERLRERADALWEKLLPHMQVASHASGAHSAYDDKVAAIGFIMTALTRRSVTSQASEGADLWPNGLPEPTIDMLDLARNLPGMPSWVRAFARATAKDGSDAQRLEGVARALEALSASPVSKRVERLETATHRHVKRGSEYVLIGYGKMQSEDWTKPGKNANASGGHYAPVDMHEVAIYRSVDDGSLWVRPREDFEDGRFQALQGGRS